MIVLSLILCYALPPMAAIFIILLIWVVSYPLTGSQGHLQNAKIYNKNKSSKLIQKTNNKVASRIEMNIISIKLMSRRSKSLGLKKRKKIFARWGFLGKHSIIGVQPVFEATCSDKQGA